MSAERHSGIGVTGGPAITKTNIDLGTHGRGEVGSVHGKLVEVVPG